MLFFSLNYLQESQTTLAFLNLLFVFLRWMFAGYLVTEMLFLLYFCCQFIWEGTPPRNLILPHLAGFLLLEKYWILPSFALPLFPWILFDSVFVESWLTFQSLQLRFWNVCFLFTSLEFFSCFSFFYYFLSLSTFFSSVFLYSFRMTIFLPFKDIAMSKKGYNFTLSKMNFFIMPFCCSLSTLEGY